MSKTFPFVTKILLLLLVIFTSCTKRFSEISIYSNLQDGDSISVALHSIILQQYHAVNGVSVTAADAIRGRVDVPLPDSLISNINALSITVHHCSDSIFTVSAIRLNRLITISPQDIMNNLWWQDGLAFTLDPESDVIKSPVVSGAAVSFPVPVIAFQRPSRLVGLQLFLRISLLVALFILVIFTTKLADSQRLIIFSIALFLASLPFKTQYSTLPMIVMLLTIMIAFARNHSRRFAWQPVFFAAAAMYLMYIAGLLVTADIPFGVTKLETALSLVTFPIVFSMLRLSRRNFALILRFFVWLSIIYCAFGLLTYASIVPEITWTMVFRDSKQYSYPLSMWPSHGQPSYVSTILLMSVPAALYLRFGQPRQITTIAETIAGVILPATFVTLAGARIGMVVFPALLALGYVFYCRFRPLLKWGIVAVGILVVAAAVYKYPKADDRYTTDPIRADLRRIALSAIAEKPIAGWGTGYVHHLIHSEERLRRLEIENAYPDDITTIHNQYLDYAVQFGIPGLTVFLAMLGWILWIAIRRRDFLLLSFLVLYLLFFFTETVLNYSRGILPFSFWFCFLITNSTLQRDVPS